MDKWEKKEHDIREWIPVIEQVVGIDAPRDMYGFAVRPQHLQRYREYMAIYKEEEEERSERWKNFLETYIDSTQEPPSDPPASEQQGKAFNKVRSWSQIRPSLAALERSLSFEKSRTTTLIAHKGANHEINDRSSFKLDSPSRSKSGISEDDSDEEFYDVERSDSIFDAFSIDSSNSGSATNSFRPGRDSYTWREELECLVQGGVPMALRGELWQAFVGTKACRVDGHYSALLEQGRDLKEESNGIPNNVKNHSLPKTVMIEKWTNQIEKDLPRTFPGHPALGEDGQNALRRLLTAYARRNPSVGYCQAMNFFAGLLLLLMSEENAFWTLTCIMDDYFYGYYSEEMVEAQVDQLVFEELVGECFPKLVTHLDKLGIQVALVTGPWFLSIFVNVLPWETVLRVWDVLLYEGNRTMLFRTALALMDLHGPELLATKDAGDAVSLFQSLAASTFDSSQLVLTACTGYQTVDETNLQTLREKHRPKILAVIHERTTEHHSLGHSQGATSKLCNNNLNKAATAVEQRLLESPKLRHEGDSNCNLVNQKSEDALYCLQRGNFKQNDSAGLTNDLVIEDMNSTAHLQEQVKWLKIELCQALEEKKTAILRLEELEKASMEMVKEENRCLLDAKVEQLESELANLKQAFSEKQQEEKAMLQKKYEEAINSLSAMEKRAVMAESMLEATLLCESSQPTSKKVPDSRSVREELSKIALLRASSQRNDSSVWNTNQEIPQEPSTRRHSLLSRTFTLGWRDRNKVMGSLDLEALLSPKSYSSGTKREIYFNEHPKSPLAENDSNGISKDHPTETDKLNVSS